MCMHSLFVEMLAAGRWKHLARASSCGGRGAVAEDRRAVGPALQSNAAMASGVGHAPVPKR